MKLIEPSVELIKQEPGIEGIYKQIEWVGRHCYMSMDKITEDSAKKFVDMLIKNGHGAMLEHGTVYLKFEDFADNDVVRYIDNTYSDVGKELCVTTNLRVLVENNWLDDLKYLCEPTPFHQKRYTLKFTTSIGITRELTRHRHMSFACESTRYCNYSKDKFSGEITFIKPYWYDNLESYSSDYISKSDFDTTLGIQEREYLKFVNNGLQPQQARELLPLATKSEIIMTGFESDWKDFFKLRCDKAAHPDMQIIANKAKELLKL